MPILAGPAAVGGVPDWTPSLERVADFVPHRTVPEAFETEGEPVNTFTATTTPPASTVLRLIGGAVGWVLAATGEPLHATQYASAEETCALRAAAFVELAGHPTVDRELAAELFRQADASLKALAARNRALTGADGDDPTAAVAVMPVWSFPSAPSWGDALLLP